MTDVIALTAQGRLRGQRDGPALRFRGVPYAESPLTAGRFAAPVPHARWDGIRDALAYGATSPQPDRGITLIPEPVIAGDNELNLNLFTPELGAAGLPVLVWIHGGGFTGGGSASPWYRGGPFARDGVVLVSINYRLGAEGFLEQSAGGAACATLLAAPAARGLFRAAACMSGAQALMQAPEGVRAVAAQMAGHLGALTPEALESMPAEAILTAQEAVSASLGAAAGRRDAESIATLLSGGIPLPWAPFADGEAVTEEPLTAAAAPRHREVSLLAGATAHEFNMAWLAADWITPAIAADGLAQAGVPAPAVAAYIDQAGSPPSQAVGQAVTDRVFRVPAQQLAVAKAAAGGSAFTYDFRWTAPGGPLPGLAFHCLDVPFFFDALAEPGVTEAMGPRPPRELAVCTHGALVRFVTDGDPGWDGFGADRSPVMIFADPSEVREDPLELERTAWAR